MKTFFGVILALVTATCLYAKDYRMVGYIACNSLPKLDAKLISYFSKLHSPLRKIPKAMDRILWASQHPQYCSDKGVLNLARMMDLERPQGLYFMVPKSSDNGKAECVIAVKRLGSSKKDTVNLLGTKFASKCFKKMRYMSLNKDALSDMKSFEELPRIKSDLKGKLICAEFLKKNPKAFKAFEKIILDYFIKPVLPGQDFKKFCKIAEKEVDILRVILEQTKEIVFDIDMKVNKLEVEAQLIPVKGSELAKFIALQKRYRGHATSVNTKKYIVVAGAMKPFPPYLKLARNLVSEISKITGTDNSKRYAEYIKSCINNGDGRFSYFVDSPDCVLQGGQFILSPIGMMGLQSKLKDKNSSTKEYKGGLYCLNPDSTSKGKEKLVCLFGKSSCLLANGSIPKLESRAVTRQLISRQVRPPRKSFLYALLHEGKDESFQFTAELSRNQGISVNMTLYKAMVSQIIPTKDDEKKKSKKKAQKANIESKTRDKLFKRYQ